MTGDGFTTRDDEERWAYRRSELGRKYGPERIRTPLRDFAGERYTESA